MAVSRLSWGRPMSGTGSHGQMQGDVGKMDAMLEQKISGPRSHRFHRNDQRRHFDAAAAFLTASIVSSTRLEIYTERAGRNSLWENPPRLMFPGVDMAGKADIKGGSFSVYALQPLTFTNPGFVDRAGHLDDNSISSRSGKFVVIGCRG